MLIKYNIFSVNYLGVFNPCCRNLILNCCNAKGEYPVSCVAKKNPIGVFLQQATRVTPVFSDCTSKIPKIPIQLKQGIENHQSLASHAAMKTSRRKNQFRSRINRPKYSVTVRDMPPLRNLPPYEDNEIVRWFANRYCVTLKEARRLFSNAETQSARSAQPFLIYNRKLKLWHGVDHQLPER